MGQRRGPCVLRRAPFGRLLRMREAELAQDEVSRTMNITLILSKRSASKDGHATGPCVLRRAPFGRLLRMRQAEPTPHAPCGKLGQELARPAVVVGVASQALQQRGIGKAGELCRRGSLAERL